MGVWRVQLVRFRQREAPAADESIYYKPLDPVDLYHPTRTITINSSNCLVCSCHFYERNQVSCRHLLRIMKATVPSDCVGYLHLIEYRDDEHYPCELR